MMSEQSPPATAPPVRPAVPSAPARRSIARFPDYRRAEAAVDALADRGFPVRRVAVVGRELEPVEEFPGCPHHSRAAVGGGAAGAVTGALLVWFLGLLGWIVPVVGGLVLTVDGLVFGAVVGAAVGLLHAAQGAHRDVPSATAMRPRTYELMVDADVAGQAVRTLGWS